MKFIVYTEVFDVPITGERAAHFIEFTGEIANGFFAFVFVFLMLRDIVHKLDGHDKGE
jgi:hypothetical protein